MKIKQVLEALERFAPLPLQESWDNAGLQIGLTEAEVSGVLLCLDVTEAIIDEAVAKGCNLVVSHHPLLFRGLKQVSDATDVQRTVRKAILGNVAVVSMHTNLDNARGGVNFRIAERLGLQRVHFGLEPEDSALSGLPAEKGQWVMGQLPQPMDARAFIAHVKDRMEVKCAMCNELLRRPISKVAICGGAGDFLLDEVIAQGADAFITGEMHYHQYFGHEQQLQICVIGHYESEHFTAELLRDIILRDCPSVRCEITEINTNPILYL
ncbi:MAG: Nif3-like dinuclear metal center hexameric protein [Prevotella sp.]|nr:Nif3-like dinuclear metal center hexameric protein [Prevotella sp.]